MLKISIIIPVYNVEKYLERCIDSILSQDFRDFELILVDDGSTDKCSEICEEYKLRDKRVIVLHKENGGLSSARNAGLEIARGEYVGFIDSDDWIEENAFPKLYQFGVKNDLEIIIFGMQVVDEFGKRKKYCGVEENQLYDRETAFYEMVCNGRFREEACNKFYKRELFEGIRYPVGRIHEDTFTTYKLIEKAERIGYYKGVFYNYFQRKDSIMANAKISFNIDRVEAIGELVECIRKYPKVYYGGVYNLLSSSCLNLEKVLVEKNDNRRNYLKQVRKLFRRNIIGILINRETPKGFKMLSIAICCSWGITKGIYRYTRRQNE